jgi:succinate dehydrogenase/fumarate reductase cytochrome b subunit
MNIGLIAFLLFIVAGIYVFITDSNIIEEKYGVTRETALIWMSSIVGGLVLINIVGETIGIPRLFTDLLGIDILRSILR